MERDEEGTHARFQSLMREVLEPLIAEGGGRIVKRTGDGALVEFTSVVEATRCAAAAQHRVREVGASVAPEQRIEFRMGINLGDVIVEPEDIYGDGVNIAARLEALAEPGGIYVSHVVADQVGDKLDLSFIDLGDHRLKNIARPVRVFRVVEKGMAATIPPRRPIVSGISVPGFKGRPAIAVLPFSNFSGDVEQEYFADGITEDIITTLASWRALPVIARNSVFTYKGRSVDIRTVGSELGVSYVLEGSVRRIGQRVRITADLIDVAANDHVFAERYDRDLTDLFTVQDEIVENIVGEVAPELLRIERERAGKSSEQDLTAYDLLQRGFFHHYRYTKEDGAAARGFFRQALQADPGYAQAAAALSINLTHAAVSGFLADADAAFQEAAQLAERAVFLDGRDPFARFALGLASFHTQQLDRAAREFQETLRVNPSFAAAYALLGNLRNYADDPAKALRYVMTALRLSPHDTRRFLWMPPLAGAYYLLGRYEEAIEAAREGLAMKPDYQHCLRYLVAALGQLDRGPEAALLLPRMHRLDSTLADTERYLGRYYRPSALSRIIDGLRKAGFT